MTKTTHLQDTTVLYLDSRPEKLTQFKSLFEGHFNVQLATSAEDAFVSINTHTVDIVIADEQVQKSSGIALLNNIKSKHPKIERILISRSKNIDILIDAILIGEVFRFIIKPFKKIEILSIIQSLHAKRENLQKEDILQMIR